MYGKNYKHKKIDAESAFSHIFVCKVVFYSSLLENRRDGLNKTDSICAGCVIGRRGEQRIFMTRGAQGGSMGGCKGGGR